jgi:hypothetical protein
MLILFSDVCFDLPRGPFARGFATEMLHAFLAFRMSIPSVQPTWYSPVSLMLYASFTDDWNKVLQCLQAVNRSCAYHATKVCKGSGGNAPRIHNLSPDEKYAQLHAPDSLPLPQESPPYVVDAPTGGLDEMMKRKIGKYRSGQKPLSSIPQSVSLPTELSRDSCTISNTAFVFLCSLCSCVTSSWY